VGSGGRQHPHLAFEHPRSDQAHICTLDGTTHHPTLHGRQDIAAISPDYTTTLTSWLNQTLCAGAVSHTGPGCQLEQ